MATAPLDPFLWATRVGGMYIFVATLTASVVTLTCALEGNCEAGLVMPLWLYGGVGAFTLISTTATYSALKTPVSKDKQTFSGNLD